MPDTVMKHFPERLYTSSHNDDYYSGPLSAKGEIIGPGTLDSTYASTKKNNQTHSHLGKGSLDLMNNQSFDSTAASGYNYSTDKALNKVLYWLNNSEIAPEDQTVSGFSNINIQSQDHHTVVTDHLMNEGSFTAKTVELNGKTLESQSKNKEVPQDETVESCNSFQANIKPMDDPSILDCMENTVPETCIIMLDNNDRNVPFLSRDPNWAISQEMKIDDVCDAKQNCTSNKEYEPLNSFTSRTYGNGDTIYKYDESRDTISDSRDKYIGIYEYTDPDSGMFSTVNSDDILISPAKKIKATPSSEVLPAQSVIETVKEQNKKSYRNKQFRCKFCDEDVSSRNFVRHLERRHNHEKEVRDVMSFPLKSKERKCLLEKLRNDSNFDLYLNGEIRPKKQLTKPIEIEYYPCIYCKAIFSRCYLNRHVKKCIGKIESHEPKKANVVSSSQTNIACALDSTDVISKLTIRKEVFNMMRGDEISFVAKKDLLIAHYGETYLRSQKRERREYSCSNKLRELARLLLTYRSIVNDNGITFKDLLHPKNFDNVVSATRRLCGYDPANKTYTKPSLAMHLGTTLKLISKELNHLILRGSKGFQSESDEMAREWQRNVKNFEKLVEARWNKEVSSVANKDLNEKRWRLLVPLINDVKKFKEEVVSYAKECEEQFFEKKDSEQTYKLLVQCTLSLLIFFNRRRIGDVQYLKVEDYVSDKKTDFQDFEATLSESEKVLTKQYKRVVNGGKGSRAVVILVPPILQNFMDLLLLNRRKYISSENRYVFALPNSTLKWAQGDVAIRHLTTKINLENPRAISSNRLRKHIATAMQVLAMSKNDCKQFSKFMGHTEKTHDEFYELPVDVFQTARVVKLLIMMEKGIPTEFKGKTLSEIELKPDEYIEDDNGIQELHARKNRSSRSHDETVRDDNLPLYKIGQTSSDHDNVDHDNVDHDNVCIMKNRRKVNKGETLSDDNLPLTEIARKLPERNTIPVKKTHRSIKKGWSSAEVQMVKSNFKSFLDKNTYPSGEDIEEFIKISKLQRSVPVIKSKIQHLLRLKNKK